MEAAAHAVGKNLVEMDNIAAAVSCFPESAVDGLVDLLAAVDMASQCFNRSLLKVCA